MLVPRFFSMDFYLFFQLSSSFVILGASLPPSKSKMDYLGLVISSCVRDFEAWTRVLACQHGVLRKCRAMDMLAVIYIHM